MQPAITDPLFAWNALDDSPTLGTLKQFLATVPDQQLLEGLRQARGHGRDDHPIRVLWGVVLLTIVLRHGSFEACLAELRRNDDLRVLIGIPRDAEHQVPDGWNVSRFLHVLGQEPHLTNLRAVFDHLVRRLGIAVPTLGEHTAGDASALNTRRPKQTPAADPAAEAHPAEGSAAALPTDPSAATPLGAKVAAAAEPPQDQVEYDDHGLPCPAGGRKEYTDENGKVVKVVEWFGYKFHLLVDVHHEVTLAYQISSTKMGDNEVLPDLLRQAQANLPAGRIKTLA
jgi:hypothetical protein